MSKLTNIAHILQRYAEVLSQVLRVDVEITDVDLIRVAATGKLKNTIGRDVSKEAVTISHTINSGETLIVKNPGIDDICKLCYKCNSCKEKFEISIPIKNGSEVIGVIGFVCHTEQQKKHVVKNLDAFLYMISQISELVEFKIIEDDKFKTLEETSQFLDKLIDVMNIGVVVYSKDSSA